jgi:hypothetical protein
MCVCAAAATTPPIAGSKPAANAISRNIQPLDRIPYNTFIRHHK